ncbi:MAG: hypothetical protein WBE17_08710, partial [Anaerolineae bacterium]
WRQFGGGIMTTTCSGLVFENYHMRYAIAGVLRTPEIFSQTLSRTALTADGTSGARLSEIRYEPWGESRYSFGGTPTQRRFTGQVLDNVAGGAVNFNYYVV